MINISRRYGVVACYGKFKQRDIKIVMKMQIRGVKSPSDEPSAFSGDTA